MFSRTVCINVSVFASLVQAGKPAQDLKAAVTFDKLRIRINARVVLWLRYLAVVQNNAYDRDPCCRRKDTVRSVWLIVPRPERATIRAGITKLRDQIHHKGVIGQRYSDAACAFDEQCIITFESAVHLLQSAPSS